jgi:hypothetical protein
VPFGRFGDLADPIDTPMAFEWLKIGFESSTMMLENVEFF